MLSGAFSLSWQNVFAESIDSYIARLETKLDVKIIYKKKLKTMG